MNSISSSKATTTHENPPITPLTPKEYFMVSLAAKVTAVFCFHPFVSIKNEIQSRATMSPLATAAPAAQKTPTAWKDKIFKVLKDAFAKYNPPKLYRGVLPNLLNAPIFATMGCINGSLKNYLSDGGKRELTQTQKLSCSIFASVMGSFPWAMLDLLVIQTQLQNKHVKPHQTDYWGIAKKVVRLDWQGFHEMMRKDRESRQIVKSQKKSTYAIFKEIFALRGFKGLFRGLLLTMGRETPFGTGLLYLGPEADRIVRQHLREEQKHMSAIISGIAVGSALSLATHPIDMSKTTTQIDWTAKIYPRLKDVWKDIYAKGGLKSFYFGTLPRLCVICIATSVVIDRTRAYTQIIQERKRIV